MEIMLWSDGRISMHLGRPLESGQGKEYLQFSGRAKLTGFSVRLLEVDFGEIDPFSMAAVQQYERALTEGKSRGLRIKALILCSPHNPLGLSSGHT